MSLIKKALLGLALLSLFALNLFAMFPSAFPFKTYGPVIPAARFDIFDMKKVAKRVEELALEGRVEEAYRLIENPAGEAGWARFLTPNTIAIVTVGVCGILIAALPNHANSPKRQGC